MSLETQKQTDPQTHPLPDKPGRLTEVLARARAYLPEQGPIGVFVHHNTLHHFEHLPFETATEEVARILGAEPYMAHDRYVSEFVGGRISQTSLVKSIEQNLASEELSRDVPTFTDVNKFYRKLLFIPKIQESPQAIAHLLAEGSYLTRFIPQVSEHAKEQIRKQTRERSKDPQGILDADVDHQSLQHLWDWIEQNIKRVPLKDEPPQPQWALRCDTTVNQRLVTFLSAYLDQGIAYWHLPNGGNGLLSCFLDFIQAGEKAIPQMNRWILPNLFNQIKGIADTEQRVFFLLDQLGIEEKESENFLQEELLKLPGWAGTISMMEARPDLFPKKQVKVSLLDYLALRLLLLAGVARDRSPRQLRTPITSNQQNIASLRFELFHFFQSLGLGSEELATLPERDLEKTVRLLQSIDEFKRRRILHQAYEDTYGSQMVDAIQVNLTKPNQVTAPSFQAMFCIDDREESVRRHLEEIEPSCETLGVAGFFGLDIRFRGINDPYSVPLCPAPVSPRFFVEEVPNDQYRNVHQVASRRRGAVQRSARNVYDSSRNFLSGTFFTVLGGLLSCFPMFFRIHFPRLSGRFLGKLHHHFFPKVESELSLERKEETAQVDGLLRGFTEEEMAQKVFAVLSGSGLAHFSPLVFVIGHGSSSLNNPHESAHDCGACGGRRGGPNARAFADMANRPGVRKRLGAMGVQIPDNTHFVGGYHDTCSDELTYFDLKHVPDALLASLHHALGQLDRARTFDAHERCRRFEDARHYPPSLALRHVQGRAQNLREPRPEYGHCTNSMCIVGRRGMTKNLFLDRRALMTSYDPTRDPKSEILVSLLSAVIPVCAGINLEYYFSYVDNENYGCGTKLPHNVTGLMGVMNGSQSDLRTGLPWQMVEIHEPVRMITVIECTRSQMEKVFAELPPVKRLVQNGWILLWVVEPGTGETFWYKGLKPQAYQNVSSTLPEYSTSRSYYEGKIEHLAPALITRREVSK